MQSKCVNVSDLLVISGIRTRGRFANFLQSGRPRHGILYIPDGQTTFYLQNGNTRTISSRQLVYIPKALRYRMLYAAESTAFVVVNFDLLENNGDPLGPPDDITLLLEKDDAHTIANIMAQFELCGAAQNRAGYYRRHELFYRLLSILYSNDDLGKEDPSCSKIMAGVLLLKQTYLENLPVQVFAKKSNMSISAFRQLFHAQYHMSPVQYRNHLRIGRARQLLEYGDCTVAEVAYACGFENIGYFCRYYKKITGQTPRQSIRHTS